MVHSLRRLALGLCLIAAAAAVLLWSDRRSRVGRTESGPASKVKRVALLQHASQGVLDQGREGLLTGLKERGWVQGEKLDLKRFNAEGDNAVSQAIAKQMAAGGYDLLLTLSTVSLQAVANANKAGLTPHVFALVSDPSVAGVGVSRERPLDHPAHLAGFGTMQPIAQAFQLARQMNPKLARVGVVWNAAEANSEAQVKLARRVCSELGIELLESTVDNSSGVAEAAGALVSRGVDALWMGGDVTVMTAADSLIAIAKKERIPVFSVIPPTAKRGALFDLGADYVEVGRLAGHLAAEILEGRSPATVAITNVMPEMLVLNQQALRDLQGTWSFPPEVVRRAQIVIDEQGVEHRPTPSPARIAPKTPDRRWRIAVLSYLESAPTEETLAGMNAAWKRSALVEGRDYQRSYRCAQGDMAALNGIVEAALTEGADLVVPISTPALQAALQKVRTAPVVFTLVANPVIAGAGQDFTNHRPNVTGVAVLSPTAEALSMIQTYFPQYRRLGTLFCPAEVNSVDLKESLEAMCQARGLTLDCVAVNSSSELTDAALSLVARPIDAVVQLSDNLSTGGFNAITKAARQAHKPLISLNSTTLPLGAPIAFGRDYYNAGEVTVGIIEKILGGASPADLPFVLPPKIFFRASLPNAAAVGMTLPAALLKAVDEVVH